MFMFQKKFVIPVVVVLVLVGLYLAAWLCSNLKARSLTVVYLSSQEIYVGHLHTFPRLTLTDAYILQTVKSTADSAKTEQQLAPLSAKSWAPTSIVLNRDQILFQGPLSEDSEAFKAIQAKSK